MQTAARRSLVWLGVSVGLGIVVLLIWLATRGGTEDASPSPGGGNELVLPKPSADPGQQRAEQARLRAKAAQSAPLDPHGNPDGDYGLLPADGFKGGKIVVWCGYEATEHLFNDMTLWAALKKKGFEVELYANAFNAEWLKNADQLWIISGKDAKLDAAKYQKIEEFARAGKGLYLLADNFPYLVEANELTKRFFGVGIQGDYRANSTAYVWQRKVPEERLARFAGNLYNVDDHRLFAGINFIYEGFTISHLTPAATLEHVLSSSDKKMLIARATAPGLRIVVDCGFTHYFSVAVHAQSGNVRLAENVALYLSGAD